MLQRVAKLCTVWQQSNNQLREKLHDFQGIGVVEIQTTFVCMKSFLINIETREKCELTPKHANLMSRKSFYNIIYWETDRIQLCWNKSSLIYFDLNYNTDCNTIYNGLLQLSYISIFK